MNHLRKPYEPTARFKATRPFTMNAVDYGYDDAVDVNGIDERRLRQMYDHRMIDVDEREPGKVPARVKAEKVTAPAVQAVATVPAIKHKGFGKHDVVNASGEVVAAGLSKEDAVQELAKLV